VELQGELLCESASHARDYMGLVMEHVEGGLERMVADWVATQQKHGAPAVVLAPGTVLSFAVPWAGPGCALHLRVTAVSFSGSSAAQGAVAVRGPSDLSHLALACGTSIVLTEVKPRRSSWPSMDLEASRAWDAHNGPRLPAWAVAAAEETMEALLSSLGVARAFPLAELASHQRLGACLSGRQHSGKTTVVRHLAWKLQRVSPPVWTTVAPCLAMMGAEDANVEDALRDVFLEAIARSPSVLIFDDLDAIISAHDDEAQAQGHEHASARLAAVFLQLAREAQSSCFGNMQVSRSWPPSGTHVTCRQTYTTPTHCP